MKEIFFSIGIGYLFGLSFLGFGFVDHVIKTQKIFKNKLLIKISTILNTVLILLGMFSYAVFYKNIKEIVPDHILWVATIAGLFSLVFSIYLYVRFYKAP